MPKPSDMSRQPEGTDSVTRLYRALPSQFVSVRKALVTELRASGDPQTADAVAKIHKPSATAWAMNQVAFSHPDVLRSFVDATEALRAAQVNASTNTAFPDARRTLKDREREIVELVRTEMAKEHLAFSAEAQRRILKTLHGLPFADPSDRARLLAGQLDKDLDLDTDFGALAGSPEHAAGESEPARGTGAPATLASPTRQEDRRKAAQEKRGAEVRARQEAKERAHAAERRRAEEARTKKLLLRARTAEAEANRLEQKALQAEAHARRARADADEAKRAAEDARAAAGSGARERDGPPPR
jgi:hypothetical protein